MHRYGLPVGTTFVLGWYGRAVRLWYGRAVHCGTDLQSGVLFFEGRRLASVPPPGRCNMRFEHHPIPAQELLGGRGELAVAVRVGLSVMRQCGAFPLPSTPRLAASVCT